MEQSVNQFNKGLQMDTHPMVQGNNTLSDCLNGTMITMSGNEVILQNDMGNRRVDNAFLPSGYTPVGMKEYGGIIYVAAYNPITNRGQLGSFPSPQRKLAINNSDYIFSFFNFLDSENTAIEKDSITIPISDNIVLHTGDKFSIYSNEIDDIIDYLVPTKQDGILKNNLFSFQIGIFNSQNEFVDISDKLIKQEIQNHKYYITKNSGINQSQSQNTLSDQELLETRNSIAVNTYSYKMSSPLYLRAKLNHVNSISYTIDGDIISESGNAKNVEFYISVTYHYNCVDNINGEYFKILFNGTPYSSLEENSINTNLNFNPIYYEELDEYQVTLNYRVPVSNITSSEYNYILEFPLLHNFNQFVNGENNIIYPIQENLTQRNSINISLLGTDSVVFSGYRYLFNNTLKLVTLELDIESYPKKIGSIYKIVPVIYDKNNNIYRLTPIQGENGKSPTSMVYTTTFNYDQLNLVEREVYHIKLQKEQNNAYSDILKQGDNQAESGLFITTPIFNGNYIGSKAFQEGVTLVGGEYEYEKDKDNYIDNFLKIKHLRLNPIIKVSTNQYSSGIEKRIDGQLIYETSSNKSSSIYDIIETYDVTTKITPTISLENIELYPSELESKFSIDAATLQIQVASREIDGNQISNNNGYKYSQNLIETRGGYTSERNIDVINIEEDPIENGEIKTTVEVHNFIEGNLVEKSILCKRVITSLYDFLMASNLFDNSQQFFHIPEPYVTVDFEGSGNRLGLLMYSGTITDHTYNDEGVKILTNTTVSPKYSQNAINDAFRQKTENLFILDYSTNDYLTGFPPIYKGHSSGSTKIQGVKRIWMRVSEKEYTPIFADSIIYNEEELSTKIFEDVNDEFKNTLTSIPHFYSYSENPKTINRKIVDYHNLISSKEFDVTSKVNVSIACSVSLTGDEEYYSINPSVRTEITISENNIKSNNLIQNELDTLNSLELDCVLEADPSTTTSVHTTRRNILYRDREGNPFDPLYVYYLYDQNNFNRGFQKSYKANKFYVSDFKCDFPELKDSSQLYHDSKGNPHPYVNPKAYSAKYRVEELLKTTLFMGWTKLAKEDFDFSKLQAKDLVQDYLVWYNVPAFLTLSENKVDCDEEITMAQYEPDEFEFNYASFTSKNIFDQVTIMNYDLYNWKGTRSDNPMGNTGWKNADEFINE